MEEGGRLWKWRMVSFWVKRIIYWHWLHCMSLFIVSLVVHPQTQQAAVSRGEKKSSMLNTIYQADQYIDKMRNKVKHLAVKEQNILSLRGW